MPDLREVEVFRDIPAEQSVLEFLGRPAAARRAGADDAGAQLGRVPVLRAERRVPQAHGQRHRGDRGHERGPTRGRRLPRRRHQRLRRPSPRHPRGHVLPARPHGGERRVRRPPRRAGPAVARRRPPPPGRGRDLISY